MDNGVRYMIHKIGTPRLQRTTTGGIAPAGEWWNGSAWGAIDGAEPIVRLNGSVLPAGGEWIEIYTAVTE